MTTLREMALEHTGLDSERQVYALVDLADVLRELLDAVKRMEGYKQPLPPPQTVGPNGYITPTFRGTMYAEGGNYTNPGH